MSAFLHVPVQFIIHLSISKSFNASGDNVNVFELFQTLTIRQPHIKRLPLGTPTLSLYSGFTNTIIWCDGSPIYATLIILNLMADFPF